MSPIDLILIPLYLAILVAQRRLARREAEKAEVAPLLEILRKIEEREGRPL
jgi:hypothetical protein